MKDIIEKWNPVPGYVGFYESSNKGSIRSLNRTLKCGRMKTGKILKQYGSEYDYLRVTLCSSIGKQTQYLVHRIITLSFFGVPDGLDVNHIDGDKHNNNLSNLEYCTRSENIKHALRIGLRDMHGENQSRSKLTKKEVLEIRKRVSNGEKVSKIHKQYKTTKGNLYNIVYRNSWRHLPANQGAAQ